MLNLDPGKDDAPSSAEPGPATAASRARTALARPAPAPSPVRREAFPQGPEARAFRRRLFPDATPQDWNDWRWQARNRLRTLADLERTFRLTPDERAAVGRHQGALPVGITPYYASLMGRDDPAEPLRRTHIPVGDEYLRSPGEYDDPLGEDAHAPAPGLVHRYPDRVLFLATAFCSTYCRYCTRSRLVGETGGEHSFGIAQWERALAYIEAHRQVRDVLLSGGDPLTLGDERLDWLLGRLSRVRHVEFVRLGTKVPVVLPQRVTRALTRILRRHRPVWMSLHFTHPAELTRETTEACARLADAGVPLGSQTVLLRGVNDDVATLKALFHGLLARRVKPYYLFQCDAIAGSAHFRTPVARGLEIVRGLRGHTTGYAVPHFVIDLPGGGGKVPLLPEYLAGREGDELVFRNFEGRTFRYHDPEGTWPPVALGEAA